MKNLNSIPTQRIAIGDWLTFTFQLLPTVQAFWQTTLGGVNLGNPPRCLYVLTHRSGDTDTQGVAKDFVEDVLVNGIVAVERPSDTVSYTSGVQVSSSCTTNAHIDQNVCSPRSLLLLMT